LTDSAALRLKQDFAVLSCKRPARHVSARRSAARLTGAEYMRGGAARIVLAPRGWLAPTIRLYRQDA
jgi:hypothetical protein